MSHDKKNESSPRVVRIRKISTEDDPAVFRTNIDRGYSSRRSYESFALPAESNTRKILEFHKHQPQDYLRKVTTMSHQTATSTTTEMVEMTNVQSSSDSSLPSSLPSSQLQSLDTNNENKDTNDLNDSNNNHNNNNNNDNRHHIHNDRSGMVDENTTSTTIMPSTTTTTKVPKSHVNPAFVADDDNDCCCNHQVSGQSSSSSSSHHHHHHPREPVEVAVRVRKVNLSYREKILNSLKGPSAFQPIFVLNGLSLTVPAGSIYGLLGPSGCGKTSLLRCIMGILKPESGKITVFGFKPGTKESGVPGPGVGFMPQEIALHADLTIDEMLKYFGRLYFIPKKELSRKIDELLEILDLPPKDRLIGTLSGGQRRRVSFASALLHKPRLLILDEPTVGVDPVLRDKIWKLLVNITKQNQTSVIITTHYIEETRRADVVGFMRKGVLLAEGNPSDLLTKYSTTTLEEVFYKLCTVQKRDSLKPVTRDTLKTLRRQSVIESKMKRKKSKVGVEFVGDVENEFDPDNLIEKKVPYEYPIYTTKLSRMYSQYHALMTKYMIQISRQPESVVGQFVLPIICLVMFCICIGGTPSHLPVAIINNENPPYLSSLLLKSINPYILEQRNYTDFDKGIEDVKRGKIWGVLQIHENFSEAIQQRIFFDENADNLTIEGSNVKLYADLTNKVLGITLDTVLVHAFEDFVKIALEEVGVNPHVGRYPVEVGQTIYGEFSTSDFFGVRDFAAPGFLIVVTFSVAYALTCLSLVRFFFVAIGTILLLTLAILLFDVPCRGPFLGVLIMLLLQSLAGMGMGLCVSAIVPDFFMCAAASNGLLIFIFIISGVLWSLETLPYYVKWFSYIQATTLPAEAMRSMLTRGLGVTHPSVWPGFVVSIVWIGIVLIAAVHIFKYQK